MQQSFEAEFRASLQEIEGANLEKVQSLNAEHRHQMEQACIKHHDDMLSLRSLLKHEHATELSKVQRNVSSLKS